MVNNGGPLRMIVLKLQDHFPMRVTDWLLASILCTWGIAALWIDPTTWNQPIYSGLNYFPREVWAAVGIIIGISRLIALFINGALRRTPHVRAVGAFLSCWVWWWLALGMLTAHQISFGIGVYPWLLIAEVYNVYRAASDARLSDNRAKMISNSPGALGNAGTAQP